MQAIFISDKLLNVTFCQKIILYLLTLTLPSEGLQHSPAQNPLLFCDKNDRNTFNILALQVLTQSVQYQKI